jgi:hypothetical protein
MNMSEHFAPTPLQVAALVLAIALVAFARGASAQDVELTPIEVLTCHFAEGKGPNDLDSVAAGFNEWMAARSAPEYAAYTLFPRAYSEDLDFDFAWIGAWPDGATMGESMAHYFAYADELAPVFDGVMNCRGNRNFSVLELRAALAPGRFDPVEVSDCTLRIGSAAAEAVDAVRAWIELSAQAGSTAAHWLLFPAYGESRERTYTFKWAIGYASYEAFGLDYDRFANGGGADQYIELFDTLMRCDSPRLYSVRPIRLP